MTAPQGTRWAEVLEVAAAAFHDRGYAGASMKEIAAALGILKGSLYHYIGSKEDLLFHVVKDSHDAGLAHVAACRALDATPLERLEAFVRGHVAIMVADRTRIAVYLNEARALSGERRAIVEAERSDYERFVVELIEACQADGSARRELDPALTALGLLGLLNWTYRWYRPEDGRTPEAIADAFLALALRGLLS